MINTTASASKYIRQIDFATFNADRKRFNQRLLDRSNSDIMSCAINYVPVSYTHLDVYKRQTT